MKKAMFLWGLILFNLALTYGQSGWTANLTVNEENYLQVTEINVQMNVDLYYNGSPVSPQSNFTYAWYRNEILIPGSTWQLLDTRTGTNDYGTHTYQDSNDVPLGKFDMYCKITIPGVGTINSDVIRIPWYCITVDQKNSSGTSFGSVDYWYKGSFKSNTGLGQKYIPRYDPKVLQASTSIEFTSQKYFNWYNGGRYSSNLNFYKISFDEIMDILSTNMTAYFTTTSNVTIRANVDNFYLDVLKFEDPWLRDFYESPFGIRNHKATLHHLYLYQMWTTILQ